MKYKEYEILEGEKIHTVSIDYCETLEDARDFIENAEKFQVNGKYDYKYTLLYFPGADDIETQYKVIGYYFYKE